MNEKFCHLKALEVDGDIFLSFFNRKETPRGCTQVEVLTQNQFYKLREDMGVIILRNKTGMDIDVEQYKFLKKYFEKGVKNESQYN
ncbi:MAG: hypothetical protein ABIE55_02270 [Candidatus Aenigmatarchaeota archaeon]